MKILPKNKMPMQFYNPYNKFPVSVARGAMSGAAAVFGGGATRRTASKYKSSRTANTLVNSRPTKKPRSNSFRSKLLKQEPAKHYEGSTTTNLTHQTIFSLVPTAGIVQGDTNAQRDGDFVDLAALKLKGIFQTAAAANGYSFRIIVGYSGEEYNLPTVLGAGLTTAEIFLPNTTGNWAVNGIINPKAFTALYDETMDINSEVAATSTIGSFSFTVPLNRKFPYQSSGSVFGKDRNLYVVVVSSGVGLGAAAPTGLTVFSYDLIFKAI